MHWLHPIPYLWDQISLSEWPTLLGRGPEHVHPGEAPRGSFYEKPSLSFDHYDISAYDTQSPEFIGCEPVKRVVDVSRAIYPLNSLYPTMTRSAPSDAHRKEWQERNYRHGRACKDASVAVIARALLCTRRFISVLPVRLTQSSSLDDVICHYGLVITLQSGRKTILPMNLHFLGAQHTADDQRMRRKGHRPQWMRTRGQRPQWKEADPNLSELCKKFNSCPILRCADVRLHCAFCTFTVVLHS
jgi:hypothetical protein